MQIIVRAFSKQILSGIQSDFILKKYKKNMTKNIAKLWDVPSDDAKFIHRNHSQSLGIRMKIEFKSRTHFAIAKDRPGL